jgi:hypothetical protein
MDISQLSDSQKKIFHQVDSFFIQKEFLAILASLEVT